MLFNNEEKTVETLRKIRIHISDERDSDLIKFEVYTSGFYRKLINFLDPSFCKSQELLGEVLWILINLTCVKDTEKLKLLFMEKLIPKLIQLLQILKLDEKNSLNEDVS